jgi:Transposase DDE domain
LANRGFCDVKLLEFLKQELNFDYIIRVRGNIIATNSSREKHTTKEWVGKSGRTRKLRHAKITGQNYEVGALVCCHHKKMKDAWCIVSSDENISGPDVIKWHSKRWGCEPQFRDTKNIYLGMSLSHTRIKSIHRRDRLLLIHAIATVLLTMLGGAGERLGLDKYLKVNTVKTRTLSLFRQGCIYFTRIPKMKKETLTKLLKEYYNIM